MRLTPEAVTALTGIRFNGALAVDFAGFVTALGGDVHATMNA